jgi:hypothetical protein
VATTLLALAASWMGYSRVQHGGME